MEEHEAVFELDSRANAYAVERLMDRLYDTVRQEHGRTVQERVTRLRY